MMMIISGEREREGERKEAAPAIDFITEISELSVFNIGSDGIHCTTLLIEIECERRTRRRSSNFPPYRHRLPGNKSVEISG
jgi:hypothetical protein